jgi:hypothetical protein
VRGAGFDHNQGEAREQCHQGKGLVKGFRKQNGAIRHTEHTAPLRKQKAGTCVHCALLRVPSAWELFTAKEERAIGEGRIGPCLCGACSMQQGTWHLKAR